MNCVDILDRTHNVITITIRVGLILSHSLSINPFSLIFSFPFLLSGIDDLLNLFVFNSVGSFRLSVEILSTGVFGVSCASSWGS